MQLINNYLTFSNTSGSSFSSLLHSVSIRASSSAALRGIVWKTICFKWPHNQKSHSVKSGDRGGHSKFVLNEINPAPCNSISKNWRVSLAVCEVAPSCWKTIPSSVPLFNSRILKSTRQNNKLVAIEMYLRIFTWEKHVPLAFDDSCFDCFFPPQKCTDPISDL